MCVHLPVSLDGVNSHHTPDSDCFCSTSRDGLTGLSENAAPQHTRARARRRRARRRSETGRRRDPRSESARPVRAPAARPARLGHLRQAGAEPAPSRCERWSRAVDAWCRTSPSNERGCPTIPGPRGRALRTARTINRTKSQSHKHRTIRGAATRGRVCARDLRGHLRKCTRARRSARPPRDL